MTAHTNRSDRRPSWSAERIARMGVSKQPSRAESFAQACAAAAAADQPLDCPACSGQAGGCGVCGGLGWVATTEWASAVQLAFAVAAGLVAVAIPPCEGDGVDVA